MKLFDIIIIAFVVLVAFIICIREYLKNKDDAKKTKKHFIKEFFNHFGDGSNYFR